MTRCLASGGEITLLRNELSINSEYGAKKRKKPSAKQGKSWKLNPRNLQSERTHHLTSYFPLEYACASQSNINQFRFWSSCFSVRITWQFSSIE